MSLSTIGGGNTTARVQEAIQRRGASGTPIALLWGSLAAAGVILSVIAMRTTWYQDVRTADGLHSGWMPALALVLVIVGGMLLVAKQVGLINAELRVSVDSLTYGAMAAGAAILILRQLLKGDMANEVYVLLLPLGVLIPVFLRAVKYETKGATLAIEQVALSAATIAGSLLVVKRLVDSEHATNGWVWGFVAAVAVIAAALAACQYLDILSSFQVVAFVALAGSIIILVVLIVQVVGDGWPVLSERLGDFWSGTLRSQSSSPDLGVSQGVVGSFWIAVFVVLLAFPVGISAAVYLEEYAPRNRLTNALDIVVRNLAGVPSVVYGLLGLFLFVKSTLILGFLIRIINWFAGPLHNFIHERSEVFRDGRGYFRDADQFFAAEYSDIVLEPGQSTLFAGGVTLAVLVLPIVIITAAEAIRAVPQSLREGAYGVGATKWEVIKSQVMPFAAPGILTGTLLALARAVGEAAPLILVGALAGRLAPRGSMLDGLDSFFGQFADRFTTMPIVIVDWVAKTGRDGGFAAAAGAAIVVLLVFVVMMNSVAVLLRNYFEKKRA